MDITMPTAIAICGVLFTSLGALIAVMRFVRDSRRDTMEDSGSEENGDANGHVRRGEWKQSCQKSEGQYNYIADALDRIESKHDVLSSWIRDVIQDHEKRLGIIEARHKDFTGDDIRQNGATLTHPPRTDRRCSRNLNDTGERRRKTDPERSLEGEYRYGADKNGISYDDESFG